MAPGNGTCHKSSKTKKKPKGPEASAPMKMPPTDESPSNIRFDPADPFHAAAEKFTSSRNRGPALRTLWDSALEIGRKRFSEETTARALAEGLKEGKALGLEEGRLLGMEEGLELGKVLGRREAKNSFAEVMKTERQRGYHIGFGDGQADQKAKQKQNGTPVAGSPDAQALADTSKAKKPENDATRVCTATAASSNDATSLPPPFTCSHDDVHQQLEDARLEGWKAGLEEGQEMEKRKGEDCNKKSEEKVTEKGVQVGRDEEDQWRTAEEHGVGLCLSMAAHMRALFCGAAFLDKTGIQTDPETTTWSDAGTQVAPRIAETAVQTNAAPDRRCATLQTEPPDEERPFSTKIEQTAATTNVRSQDVSNTKGTAVRAYDDHRQSFPAPKSRPQEGETVTLTKNGPTTTRSHSPATPAKPLPVEGEPSPKNGHILHTSPRMPPFTPQPIVFPAPTSPPQHFHVIKDTATYTPYPKPIEKGNSVYATPLHTHTFAQ